MPDVISDTNGKLCVGSYHMWRLLSNPDNYSFVTVDLDQVLTGAPLYTTTVRKPLDHLKSVFNYFAMADKFGKLTLHSRFHSSFCYKNTINTHYIISLILVFTAVFHKRASDSLKKLILLLFLWLIV